MTAIYRVLSLVFLLLATPALAEWPAESAALGAKEHPKVMQKFGGAVQNDALAAYVADIGAQLVALSSRPNETWQFTVLDTPEVNAFALPGGYVYVTRGLLALANNESELAAVLAHEITHVIEAHVEARQQAQKDALLNGALNALVTGIFGGSENRVGEAVRSGVETAMGEIGAYSKEQEFAADAGGIELLRLAGYRPAAQADFLAAMAANAALKAEMAGREYDESRAPVFAAHPAPAERQSRALALAADATGRKGVDAYLSMIDGMIFGQSARGGIVRGQTFVHPVLGFSFTAAQGLRIENGARQINILGPNRSTLILSGAADRAGLRDALTAWFQQIPRNQRQSRALANMRLLEINGLEAATATLQMRNRGQRSTLRLTVIRFNGELVRFAGKVRRGDDEAAAQQWETVLSFKALGEAAAADIAETTIKVRRVLPGETAASLGREMAVPGYGEAYFRVLNGLAPQEEVSPGVPVKLVSL